MKAREPEPLEQVDYGIGYKAQNSPQQHMTLKVDGGAFAIALSIFAIACAIAAWVLIPQINAANTRAEIANATKQIAVQAQSAQDRAWLAERNSTLNAEQMKELRIALADKGFTPRLDGH